MRAPHKPKSRRPSRRWSRSPRHFASPPVCTSTTAGNAGTAAALRSFPPSIRRAWGARVSSSLPSFQMPAGFFLPFFWSNDWGFFELRLCDGEAWFWYGRIWYQYGAKDSSFAIKGYALLRFWLSFLYEMRIRDKACWRTCFCC